MPCPADKGRMKDLTKLSLNMNSKEGGVRSLFLALLFLAIFLPSAYSLGLNGLKLSPISYEPGKNITNHYVIDGTDKPVEVYLGGEIAKYARATEIKDHQFDLIINFPNEYIPSGSYSFSLSVKEIEDESVQGVGSLLSVTKVND